MKETPEQFMEAWRYANGSVPYPLKADTCRGCAWQEGGLCYLEPCERREDGRSKKIAGTRCPGFCRVLPLT